MLKKRKKNAPERAQFQDAAGRSVAGGKKGVFSTWFRVVSGERPCVQKRRKREGQGGSKPQEFN